MRTFAFWEPRNHVETRWGALETRKSIILRELQDLWGRKFELGSPENTSNHGVERVGGRRHAASGLYSFPDVLLLTSGISM